MPSRASCPRRVSNIYALPDVSWRLIISLATFRSRSAWGDGESAQVRAGGWSAFYTHALAVLEDTTAVSGSQESRPQSVVPLSFHGGKALDASLLMIPKVASAGCVRFERARRTSAEP
jgi:hypothetical protein